MKRKMEKFPEKNPNPVLCVSKNSTVLYSNEASKPLLNEWGTKNGEKLPSYIGDFVQKVISRNSPEKMEIKAGNRIFLLSFHPLSENECVNIYGFDISDQKALEEELREREERLQLAQQVAKIGTFEWNIQTGVNLWTPELEAMYGLLPGEFGKIQQAWEQLIHPDDRQKAINIVDQTFQTGKPVEGEWRVIWPDGSVHWVTGRFQVLNDESGQPLRLTGVNIDITEHKQAEEVWRDSKIRVDSIFRSSPIGIGIVVGRIVKEANERLCELTGYSREELLGSNALMLYSTVEEYERVGRVKYGMIAEHGVGHVETRWRRKDGSVVDILLSSSPIIPGDLSGEITFTVLDITERKRAEEALRESEARFRSYFEMPLVGILITSLDKGVIRVNDKFCTLVGYSADDLKGTTWDEITHPEDLAKDVKRFNQVLAGEIDSYTMEKRFIHKNGTSIPTILSVGCVRHLDHTVNYLVATVQDITERKKMEDALKKANDTLEAKVKERIAELEKAYNSLKESEVRLAEAQELAHIGSWERNFATNKFNWSDEMYRIFGLKPQEFEVNFHAFLNYVHLDDRDRIDNAGKEALSGKPVGIDFRINRINGEERIVHTKAEVVLDEKSIPIRIKGTTQDITDLKKTEEKLRESEEKYRNIVETANEGISISNDEGIITFVNQKMADMLGYPTEEIIGRKIWDFVGKKDQSTVTMNWEKRRRGLNANYDVKLIRNDGSPIWVYINSNPIFDDTGRFMGSLNMHTDINERKMFEEQSRQRAEEMTKVLDVAPVVILIGYDPQGHNITGNLTANELFETEVGENISASITSVRRFFCKGRELTADKLPMQKASLKDIDVRNVEFDVLLPSGECRSLMGSASPLHDAEGHVRGSVGAFMDVTERKQAEETLRNFEIARKKEIHHRIKNNLQVISSLLDLQAGRFKGRKNIRDSEVLSAFKESMDRVLSIALIHEALYKGENIDVLNFSQYIKELANSLLLTYTLDTDVNFNFDLEENLFLDMDTAIPLGIVINEIISNSFKYAFSGRDKGEIRIKLNREKNGECKIENCKNAVFVLTVSDNGIGIPKNLNIEDLDSLGLQLVTILVDQLDGKLELKKDNGTEFTIRFTVTENNQISKIPIPQLLDSD